MNPRNADHRDLKRLRRDYVCINSVRRREEEEEENTFIRQN